jgi:hypothetical protein
VALQLLYLAAAGRPVFLEKTSSLQHSLHMFDTNVEHLNGNLASIISLLNDQMSLLHPSVHQECLHACHEGFLHVFTVE